MPREPRQPAFADVQIDDEELEAQLRVVLENQPTAEDILRGKARRAASKKARAILLLRHRDKLYRAQAEAEWIRVGDAALISPVLVHHNEETKQVTYYPGGEDAVTFDIRPASWQLELGEPPPEAETVTMTVDGAEAAVRRARRAPPADGEALSPAASALIDEARSTPATEAEAEARQEAEARLAAYARP